MQKPRFSNGSMVIWQRQPALVIRSRLDGTDYVYTILTATPDQVTGKDREESGGAHMNIAENALSAATSETVRQTPDHP